MNAHPTHVVILGAGFGGLSSALEIARLNIQRAQDTAASIQVTIIDRNDFQLFTPDLYEIAAAAQSIQSEEDLKNTVCLDVKLALAKQSITYMQATVKSIHPAENEKYVIVQDAHSVTDTKANERKIQYDYLIVALGSEPFYFGIPGMAEHSIPFKWIEHPIAIRKKIYALLDETAQSETKQPPHIVLCGGGAAGVEVAAELMNMCHKKGKMVRMTLIEGQPTVLPPCTPKAQMVATRRLQKLGVTLKTNCRIVKAEAGKVFTQEGEEIAADMIVWTGGVKASSLLEQCHFQLGKRGQIPVYPTLQCKQYPDVFVLGDAAEVAIGENTFAPQTAHEAFHQGPIVSRNVFNQIDGQPLVPYIMKNEGMVITLGGKQGIVQLPNGMVLSGYIGWLVRKYVDFRHFKAVLPFMHACSVWYKGMRVFMKND